MASDWLIGSYPDLEEQSLTVTTAGPVAEACVIAAGDYYLEDANSDWDLLDALETALNSHSVVSGCLVYLRDDRRVEIESGATNFAVTWPADTILRGLLGFTGNLVSAPVHTATNVSPLLWSPGKNNNPTEARRGTDGILVEDIAVGQSGPGTVRATRHNSYRRNTLIYRYLLNSRVWTTSEAGGEFFKFYQDVLSMRRRFKVWLDVDEGESGDPATLSSKIPSTGAYIYSGGPEMPWGREFGFVEQAHPITIPVVTTREFDAP